MNFADRLLEASRAKRSIVVAGIDPQLDASDAPGIPPGYTLTSFCCAVIEACAPIAVAIKPQFAFFEARGFDGMRALRDVIRYGRHRGLLVIGDAKRGDIGSTSAAYAEAILGDGDFGCDAATVNPYLGSDAMAPFVMRVTAGRGVFVLVKTSNPSSGEFQDLDVSGRAVWQRVARRVHGWGSDYIGENGLSPVGAVVGATYPEHARRARELMPNATILVPGYGTQGGSDSDAVAAARVDGTGVIVSSSRSVMYAYKNLRGRSVGAAASEVAQSMRASLNNALAKRQQ